MEIKGVTVSKNETIHRENHARKSAKRKCLSAIDEFWQSVV